MGGRAAQDPDTPYFHLFDEAVPYGRLWRESARYAAGLKRAGIDRGDKVCLIYPTCAEFFYTFFGALRLGAVPVPLYPTLGVEATAFVAEIHGFQGRHFGRQTPARAIGAGSSSSRSPSSGSSGASAHMAGSSARNCSR